MPATGCSAPTRRRSGRSSTGRSRRLDERFESVRISATGELPPKGNGPVEAIDEDRLGTLGRATLRTVTAVDQRGRPAHGPGSYLLVVSQVLPGWVLALLGGALLLPVLVTAVDALARARRRQMPVFPWLRWVAAWTAPFLAGFAVAEVLALAGATPAPPPAPVPPAEVPLDGPALGVLAGVVAATLLAFALARFLAAWPDPSLRRPVGPGAAVALALVLSGAALVLWLVNPYAGLLAVPAAHVWTIVVLTRPSPRRRTRAIMIALGILPALLVALYYLVELSIDPLEGMWYLLMLVTGHTVGFMTSLVACVMLGAFCGVVEIAVRLPEEPTAQEPQLGPSIYGPGAHAGPGALGGTESALRG